MAEVGGARIPIVLDLTNIDKAEADLRKKLSKIGKDAENIRLKLNTTQIEDLSRTTLRRLIKDLQQAEERAHKFKLAIGEIGKALAKVRSGQAIGRSTMEAMQDMPGIGKATKTSMAAYKKHQAAANDPGATGKARAAATRAMNAEQQKLINLLKTAEQYNKRNLELTKQQLDVKVQYTKSVMPIEQQRMQALMKTNSKMVEQARTTLSLHKKESLTKDELVKLGERLTRLGQQNIRIEGENLKLQKQAVKAYKQKQKASAGLIGKGLKGRAWWFVQLRLLWGLLRVLGSITEAMLQLDRATARAMRTMVQGVKDYHKWQEKVRQSIIDTAKITGETYENIGEALYQLSSAGLSAEESMAALQSTVKLAKVTESDMTDTTKVVAGAFNNFGDKMDDVATKSEKFIKISGTLSYVWKRNQIDMNELVQGLNQSAQSGRLAGLQFEELAVILGNMGTRMIRSGRAGRMLRSAVINIAQKSERVKEVFDVTFDPDKPMDLVNVLGQMAEKYNDSNKSMKTTAAIFDIFGKRGAPAMISILNSWTKIRKEMKGVNDTMALAVEQHETMLMTQTHYKALTERMWANILGLVGEYIDYTKVIKGFLISISRHADRMTLYKDSQKSTKELSEKYKDASAVQQRLVDVQAKFNIALAEGENVTEVHMKNMQKLIEKLKLLKQAHDEEAEAQKRVIVQKEYMIMTDENMAVAMMIVDAELDAMNEKAGRTTESLEDLGDKTAEAYKKLQEARTAAAKEQVRATYGMTEADPEVMKTLKKANEDYQRLYMKWQALRNEMQQAAQDKRMAGFGAEGDATYQKSKGEEEAGRKARQSADWQAMKAGWVMQELENKRELDEIELALNEKYMARNMTDKEKEEFMREREAEKIEHMQAMIDKQLELNLAQQNAEEIALMKATSPEEEDKAMANLNALQTKEAELQQQKQIWAQQAKANDMTYDQFQKKRIQGLYKEKGAMAAAKGMWQAYGDTIGQAAEKGLQSWMSMMQQMGQKSKAAWTAYQAMAIGQAIIDTYKTAQAGASALAGIPFVGPVLAGMWIATSVAQGMMRVQQIRAQKPQSAAKGGVFDGSFEAYAQGGVTSGVAAGIIGDNPSGKELVIPSENISRNHVSGYVQEGGAGGGQPIQVVNMVTQQDIAQAMYESDEGKNVVINHIGRDMNEKGSTYQDIKKSTKKEE